MVNQYYGLKLQELCEAKEITKNEIIKKTGIPKSSLSRFFSGEGYLNLDQIDALLEFLNMIIISIILNIVFTKNYLVKSTKRQRIIILKN